MRSTGLFTILKLTAFFVSLNLFAFGQGKILIPDAKRDSSWVQQSLAKLNAQSANNKDTNQVMHKWLSGKVLYCPDGSLKATQLTATPDTFITTIQYLHRGKMAEQRFDYTGLANYKLDKIYRLTDKTTGSSFFAFEYRVSVRS